MRESFLSEASKGRRVYCELLSLEKFPGKYILDLVRIIGASFSFRVFCERLAHGQFHIIT